jgi:mannose-6-phosphate isomerase-like protein (cupin superfamily)
MSTSPDRTRDEGKQKGFQIFRFRDCGEDDSAVMDFGETLQAASDNTRSAFYQSHQGAENIGAETRCLFRGAGMSILYVWFKSGFPLLRHTHDVDCAYIILAGSLKVGTEELGAGHGFFVPANVPYVYTVGSEGMEMIEFRGAESCNMRLTGGNADHWARYAAKLRERVHLWRDEPRPSGIKAPYVAHSGAI